MAPSDAHERAVRTVVESGDVTWERGCDVRPSTTSMWRHGLDLAW